MYVRRGPSALDFYLEEVRRHAMLSPEEERELARAARAGDGSARDRLVTANLRFVVLVASRYQDMGLPLEDLICEGNQGLVRATETFDPERGVRFVTYAVGWIRVRITRALASAPVVRLPSSQEREVRRVRIAAGRLATQTGARATSHEVAAALGMDERDVAAALNALYTHSLEDTVADTDLRLAEVIPGTDPRPDDVAAETEREDVITAVLQTLPEREATIIRLAYGLDGPPLSHRQIAERFGLSTQRIQQLVQQALKRLREPARASRLLALSDGIAPERAAELTSAPPGRRRPPESDELRTLRHFFRQEVGRTSVKRTARAVGVGRNGLSKFVSGETLQPRPDALARMRAYYQSRQGGHDGGRARDAGHLSATARGGDSDISDSAAATS